MDSELAAGLMPQAVLEGAVGNRSNKKASHVSKKHRRGRKTASMRRRGKRKRVPSSGDAAALEEEDIDPITRTKVSDFESAVFELNSRQYDSAHLIGFFQATGDFRDPVTRAPLSERDLKRLDRCGRRNRKMGVARDVGAVAEPPPPAAATAFGAATSAFAVFSSSLSSSSPKSKPKRAKSKRYESLVAASKSKTVKLALEESKFRSDAKGDLERLCGDVVSEIFDLVEAVNEERIPANLAESVFFQELYPSFVELIGQIRSVDAPYAKLVARRFLVFLKGPDNRPVVSNALHRTVLSVLGGFAK